MPLLEACWSPIDKRHRREVLPAPARPPVPPAQGTAHPGVPKLRQRHGRWLCARLPSVMVARRRGALRAPPEGTLGSHSFTERSVPARTPSNFPFWRGARPSPTPAPPHRAASCWGAAVGGESAGNRGPGHAPPQLAPHLPSRCLHVTRLLPTGTQHPAWGTRAFQSPRARGICHRPSVAVGDSQTSLSLILTPNT